MITDIFIFSNIIYNNNKIEIIIIMNLVYENIIYIIIYFNFYNKQKNTMNWNKSSSYKIKMIKSKYDIYHNFNSRVGSKYHKKSKTNGGWSNRATNNNYN